MATKAVGEGFVLLDNPATRTGFLKLVETASIKVEDALQHIPAFRELVIRNTQNIVSTSAKQLAGETTQQFLTRNGKSIAIGLLIKRPIVYQTNIGLAENIHDHLLEGNYPEVVKDSAWLAVQALGGGPLGYVLRKGKSLGVKMGELARGKGSFIDEISKQVGTYKFNQIAEYIKANPEARLWQRANNVENQIVKLNKEKRALIEKDAPREAVKRKEDEILKKMTDFNNQVRRGQ